VHLRPYQHVNNIVLLCVKMCRMRLFHLFTKAVEHVDDVLKGLAAHHIAWKCHIIIPAC
jgi:hypothetical protein